MGMDDDQPVFREVECCCQKHAGANKCPDCLIHKG